MVIIFMLAVVMPGSLGVVPPDSTIWREGRSMVSGKLLIAGCSEADVCSLSSSALVQCLATHLDPALERRSSVSRLLEQLANGSGFGRLALVDEAGGELYADATSRRTELEDDGD